MTGRRPPGTSTGSWIEQQVQTATEQGAFDDLPLAGQPLRHLEEPTGDYDQVARIAAREGLDPLTLLPPTLAVRREVEDLPGVLDLLSDEAVVRGTVLELNERIRDLLLMPMGGPPMRTSLLDVEATVQGWRQRRPGPGPTTPHEPTPASAAAPPRRRLRSFRPRG